MQTKVRLLIAGLILAPALAVPGVATADVPTFDSVSIDNSTIYPYASRSMYVTPGGAPVTLESTATVRFLTDPISFTDDDPEGTVQVVVTNPAGQAVRTGRTTGLPWRYFTWDGRSDRGVAVPPGLYGITLRATAPDGSTGTVRAGTVTVVHKQVSMRNVSPPVAGKHTSGVKRSGACSIHKTPVRGVRWPSRKAALLDCMGTGSVSATYAFTVPADATRLKASTSGLFPSALDRCCGSVKIRVKRPSHRKVKITLTVTGGRAYLVNTVNLQYVAKGWI